MYDTVKGSDWLGTFLVKHNKSVILFAVFLHSILIGCLNDANWVLYKAQCVIIILSPSKSLQYHIIQCLALYFPVIYTFLA